MDLNKKCYVYKFIDKNNKCMYVGQSQCLSTRINQHLGLKSKKFTKKLLKEIQRVEYIKVRDRIEARQYEIYYINKYKPYLNKADLYHNVYFKENQNYERVWKIYKVFSENKNITHTQRKVLICIPYIIYVMVVIMLIFN